MVRLDFCSGKQVVSRNILVVVIVIQDRCDVGGGVVGGVNVFWNRGSREMNTFVFMTETS